MAALINAHTHLSLSALAHLARKGLGFVDWVRELIQARDKLTENQVRVAALQAAAAARSSGTGCMAEVGPVEPGREALQISGMDGVVFLEVLGNVLPLSPLLNNRNGVCVSLAGHGLHTTSPSVLQALKKAATDAGRPFSLHLAESEAETEFLATGRGQWADLLESRGVSYSEWGLENERPVERAARLGLLGPDTLAVHVLDADTADVSILAASGATVCVCPRSNFALHGRLPDIAALMRSGVRIALGTDSLASAPSLNLFEEMSFASTKYPSLEPTAILQMASKNGAHALARPDLGTLRPELKARLIHVELTARSAAEAEEKLVAGEFVGVRRI
jgi:cytosine/adenosine deaminase-related metal-dependent hydrolase